MSYHRKSRANELSETIGNYLLCVCQALFKTDGSNLMRKIRLGLGEYALSVHSADFVSPEKRESLLLEIVRCLDKDNLSEDQFLDEVLRLRSSDHVRHKLKEVQDVIRDKNVSSSPTDEEDSSFAQAGKKRRYDDPPPSRSSSGARRSSEEPTFEDMYDRPTKKAKARTKAWNPDEFVGSVLDTIFEEGDESEFDIIENSPGATIYLHVDYPNQERILEEDLRALLMDDKHELKLFPKGLILSLLSVVVKSLERKDLNAMPREYVRSLKDKASKYPFFENSILDDV